MAKLNAATTKGLNEYLNEKKTMITQPGVTTSDVAGWCREAGLGEIDVGNITCRVGPNGSLYTHEWPGSEASRKGRISDRAARNIVVAQLERFRLDLLALGRELGDLAPAGIGALAPGWLDVVKQMRSDEADTDHREEEEK